jgi:Isochorismatase family
MQSLTFRLIFFGFFGSQLHIALCAASAADPKGGMVMLDAKPEPIAIDPARCAVIVVDMENDFVAKGGMFDRAGRDISGAQKAIPSIAKVLAAGRQAGLRSSILRWLID